MLTTEVVPVLRLGNRADRGCLALITQPATTHDVCMYIRVFGGSETVLPDGWTDEIVLSVMSGAQIDATAKPGDGARLTVVSIFSGTKVLVPPGAQIRMTGGDVLGSHSVKVEPGVGPEIEIQAIPIMGSVKVRSPKPTDLFR